MLRVYAKLKLAIATHHSESRNIVCSIRRTKCVMADYDKFGPMTLVAMLGTQMQMKACDY